MMKAIGKQSSVRASHLRPTNMASNDAILSRSECSLKSPEAQRRVHEDHQDDVHDQDRSVLSLCPDSSSHTPQGQRLLEAPVARVSTVSSCCLCGTGLATQKAMNARRGRKVLRMQRQR